MAALRGRDTLKSDSKNRNPGRPCGVPGLYLPQRHMQAGVLFGSQEESKNHMTDRQLLIPYELTSDQCVALKNTFSPLRLGKYLVSSGFNVSKAIDLYRWNAFVGECLHFPIQTTEIAVRNCVHAAITKQFGVNWYEAQDFIAALTPESISDLDTAKRRLRNRLDKFVADDVVATMSLGFWVSILDPRYYQLIWRHEFRSSFPNLPPKRAFKSIHMRARDILSLRNRVAHHEPLIGRDLSLEHTNIIEFISWICPETSEWARRHSFVPEALRQRP